MMEVNIWSPLDESRAEIRLITLLPHTDWQAPISCRLSTASLKLKMIYEAVSYVWGTAKHVSPITLQGRTHYISENLESCLRHLRYETTERVLWVDSICIDQASNAEKSSQVALMRHIYKRAHRVCAWLGEGSAEVTRAFRIVRAIAESGRFVNVFVEGSRLTAEDFGFLPSIVQSEWWTRVWVVQEVSQLNYVSLYSGREMMDFDVLMNFVFVWTETIEKLTEETDRFLRNDDHPVPSTFSFGCLSPVASLVGIIIVYHRILSGKAGYGDTFLQVLARCRDRKATRLPDKVYGLLALGPEDFGTAFRPNFDLSAEQAYVQFAITYLEYTRDLSLLNQCSLQQKSIAALPSWVPDWSSNHYSFADNVTRLGFQAHYKACGDKTLVFEVSNDNLLCLQGIFIDTISRTSSLALPYGHFQGTAKDNRVTYAGVFDRWQHMIFANKHHRWRYVAGDNIFNVYWRVLFGDLMDPGYQNQPSARIRRCKGSDAIVYRAWQKALDTFQGAPAAAGARVTDATDSRRMFRCGKGYIGLGPREIKAGDHVYVVAGGRVPLILRTVEQAAQTNTFQLVGECYVHGIMDGEAVAASSNPRKIEKLRDSLYRKAFGGDGPDLDLGQRGFEKIYLL